VATEGSFSDDMPTRMREDLPREGHPPAGPSPEGHSDRSPGFHRLPQGNEPQWGEPSREHSFSDDQEVTREREPSSPGSGPAPETGSEQDDELEALLDPERGLAAAQRLHLTGEHERSLELAERLAARYPHLPLDGLEPLILENQEALEQIYIERLGPLQCIPVPQAGAERLDSLDLDPRAVFLLTRIDGTLSVEDLLDISGMSRFETARLLLRLRELSLLSFEPGR
jgi:hypothetical protein